MMKMKSLPKFDFILSVAVTLTTLLLCFDFIGAERDFNFNDSQVPLLEPKEEPPHTQHNNKNNQDPYAAEVSRCHYADSEIILSLILKNHDWHDLGDNKKAKVLEKFSKFFAIPKEFIKMESVTKRDLNEMQKESIRKGNNKCHSNRRLGRVNIMIGCGATYFTIGEPIVNQIGAQMKDGSIDNIIGEKFGLWIVWRKHYKTGAQRNRRQIEGSGEDDYDEDDYDYDDDDEEAVGTVTEIPAPAPTVTMHAHRHHHGDGSQPESNENKLDLINNNFAAAATTDTGDIGTAYAKSDDSSLLLNKNSNIDEEIVESVSQLESVITKTIENTKNIKDLPVIDEEVVEEVVVEEEGEEVPVPVEIEKELEQPARGGVALEEFDNELEQRKVIPPQKKINLNNVYEITPKTTTIIASSGITTAAASASSTTTTTLAAETATATTKQIFNLNNADVNDDEIEENEDDALEASVLLNRNLNVNAAVINSLASPIADVDDNTANADAVVNVAEVIESSSIATTATSAPPSSSSPSSMSTLSAAVGLKHILSSTINTNANNTTVITIPPPLSTLRNGISSVTTSVTPLPPSSYTPSFDASSSSYPVSVVPSPSPPPSSISFISSLSSSPSSSSVYVSSTTTTATTTATPITSVTTTLQTKDENEATTLLPVDNQDLNANLIPLNTTRNEYGGTPTSSSSSAASSPATTLTTTPTSISAADPTTPSTASTDYFEPKVKNMPPIIRTRLQKFAVTSGKSFTFTVPDNTFDDTEDNTNLRLDLTDKDGHELKPSSWLQFDSESRQIYGLPLDDAVSKWQYRLSATDSGNETVTETLEMSVQQHRSVRTVNHEISITVKINEKNVHNIYWQLKLMKAIASTLADDTSNSIVVREIRSMPQDSNTATFVYFNETLPTSGECPESELNNIVKHLDANRLSDLVYPTLGVKSITGQLIGACQKTHLIKPKPTTYMTKNQPPVLRNQVDRVNATVGHLLVFKVPSDTFYDPNDNELTLTLKTKDYKDLNPRHWLQFDSKNQEFYGIPKSGDVSSEEYLLIAEDSGGLSTSDALVVVVSHAPKREFSVYFKAYLAIQHEHFNADLQRKFVERISQLFGDQSTQNLQIRSMTTQHDLASTIVNFYNTTLYKTHNRCPDEEIEATRNVYLMQDHSVRDRVKKALGPELNLTNVQVIPFSSCHLITDVTHREFIPTKTDEPLLKSTFSEEYMYTFILPAVIILVMILVASIIACCLHRRRRKSGKMELGDEEERKSFRTKGIPVIFQDELDEKPEIGNKSPIILKDEKPPLLPPSYNTSNMNGDNDVDEYVPPPAVVVGGREARGKSPATPSYRKPPPYVSP